MTLPLKPKWTAEAEIVQVPAEDVRIGKDVIEILTSGMYVDPITIYREYVQNAADSVDTARAVGALQQSELGRVLISFDQSNRSVVIRDNGAGIPADDVVSTLLSIGASPKRGTNARGFRGVGRLSALGYCRELKFKTKFASEGEVVSLHWNCVRLRELLRDPSFDGDLKKVIADVVTVRREGVEAVRDHFFEVTLSDVARLRGDVLMNENLVSRYLAQVAPVPFSSDFSFAPRIEEHLAKHGRTPSIELTVGRDVVRRPFRDECELPGSKNKLTIEDVELLEFADVDGKIGAVGWIAHHGYVRSIPATIGIRGIRARFGDLQVGNESIFDESFKEPRFNAWSIGELTIIDRRVVPNARRDNFEINHHYYNFLVQLGPVATKIMQRCRVASISRNAEQGVRNVVDDLTARLKLKHSFDRAELSQVKLSLQTARQKLRRIASEPIRRRLENKLNGLSIKLDSFRPKKGKPIVALEAASRLVSKVVTNRDQMRKLIAALQRLAG